MNDGTRSGVPIVSEGVDDTVQGSAPTAVAAHDRRVLRRVSLAGPGAGPRPGLLCIGFGVYALGGHDTHHGLAQAELEFAVGLIAGVVLDRSPVGPLGRGARAAYSPLLLLELICLPVAWGLAQGHQWGYAVAGRLSRRSSWSWSLFAGRSDAGSSPATPTTTDDRYTTERYSSTSSPSRS